MPFLASRIRTFSLYTLLEFIPFLYRQKSVIECLPLEVFDAEEVEAFLSQAQYGSLPMTPEDTIESPVFLSGTSVEVDTSTGKHDFHDPGGSRWEGLETRGFPGNGTSYGGGSGSPSHN